MKARYLIGIAAVNLLCIGAGIAVLELVFGDWIHANQLNRLQLIRSQSLKFDIAGLYPAASGTATYTRDQYGLRGAFADPAQIAILTVGGSTTDQRYLSDGQTWQDALQQRFAAAGKQVVVANAGVDGQSTVGHLKDFEWWFPTIPGLHPRYILFYVGLNDFYKDRGGNYDLFVADKGEKTLRQILKEKSALYHALQTLRGVYQAEFVLGIGHRRVDFGALSWTREPLQSGYEELMKDRLAEYAQRLALLVDRTRAMGATPIFVTQPSRRYRRAGEAIEGTTETLPYGEVPVNGIDFYFMMRKLDAVTMAACSPDAGLCLDMAGETSWEDSDFYDYAHMTPAGAQKVGTYLFARLHDKF